MTKQDVERVIHDQWATIKHIAISIIGDHSVADDALQIAFLKAMETTTLPQQNKNIVSWFTSIVKRTAIDILRRQQSERKKMSTVALDHIISEPETTASICSCLTAVIDDLGSQDQQLLHALEFNRVTTKDYAKQLGISLSALKVRRHRARQRLKQKLIKTCGPQAPQTCANSCEC